jgi:cytochrome P450
MPRLDGACHLLCRLNEIHDMMNRPDSSVLLDLLSDRIDDIYTCYAALRRDAGVVRDASGALLVTRHCTVVETIANPQFAFVSRHAFSSAGPELRTRLAETGYFDLLMFRKGESHRTTRRVLSELFSSAQLGRVRTAVEAKAAELLQPLSSGEPLDFIPHVAATLPVHALRALFGLAEEEMLSLVARSRRVAGLLSAVPLDTGELSDSVTEFADLVAWAEPLFRGRSSGHNAIRPLETPLDASSPAERVALVADLVALLVTGYDTSQAMLGNAAAALFEQPGANALPTEDPALVARMADELIRYDTAGQIVFRHALEDTTIGDHRVAKGEMLALLIGSANRDADEFAHPDRLDFTRRRGRVLSFGAGPHACPGASVAKIQLIAFLNAAGPHLSRVVSDPPSSRARQRGLLRDRERLVLNALPCAVKRRSDVSWAATT